MKEINRKFGSSNLSSPTQKKQQYFDYEKKENEQDIKSHRALQYRTKKKDIIDL